MKKEKREEKERMARDDACVSAKAKEGKEGKGKEGEGKGEEEEGNSPARVG